MKAIVVACALTAALGAAPRAHAQVDPAVLAANGKLGAARVPLPYLDVRQDELVARGSEAQAARLREIEDLRARLPGLRVVDHEFFGTPRWIGSTEVLLTPPSELAPRDVVRTFVAWHPALFEIAPAVLTDASLRRDFVTQHNGVTHLGFGQRLDGLELVGCALEASVTRHGELINVSSTWLPDPPGGFELGTPILSAAEALRAAAADLGAPLEQEPELASSVESGPASWHAGKALDELPLPTTERVVFPLTRSTLVPAWRVALAPRGGDTYVSIVSAVDGRILQRADQTHYLGGSEDLTLRVYTHDSPAPGSPGPAVPNGQQFPIVPRDLVTISAAAVAPFSPLGWIPDGQNETQGNNVDAHTDIDANQQADLPRPSGSPYRVFDFAQSNAQPPSSWRPAAVAQVFWFANSFHDHAWTLGFDEAAGNFQSQNLGGQGLGSDRVSADCQDGGGFDNARFTTFGNDGSFARMEMFVFDGPVPDRDGGMDAMIVYHELTHGISTRLHNGTLGGVQSAGMGEGWSDFFALCLTSEAGEDPAASYALPGFTSQEFWPLFADNYYFGIRRYPYTTDLAKNPLTFADIDPGQFAVPPGVPRNANVSPSVAEAHNVGEVWCEALWEVRANLIASQGFGANDTIQELLVDGMKLSLDNPNFLEARDAILQADLVDHAGADLYDLWRGFAKRGLGASASSPAGGNNSSGIVEAFDLPVLIQFAYPAGRPSSAGPGLTSSFALDVLAANGQSVLPGSALLNVSIDGAPYTSTALVETAPGHFTVQLPAADCPAQLSWYVTLGSTFGPAQDPPMGVVAPYKLYVVTGASPVQLEDMENPNGWNSGAAGDTATTGQWARTDPIGTLSGLGIEVQPELDHSDNPGTQCWFTGQGQVGGTISASDVDGGRTTLLSPLFDVSALAAPRIGYWRWFSNDQGAAPAEDVLRVEISGDGGANWSTAEVVGPASENHGGWLYHELFVADYVTPSNQVRLRFVAEDAGLPSVVEAAIDDLQVLGSSCQPRTGNFCAGDGTLATPCPCANFGTGRHGCGNSINALGALLKGSGSTQPDQHVLHASGLPTSTPVLFFQGDQAHANGVVLGDGLGCVTGSIVRLGTRTASAGLVDFPSPGDPPLSSFGGVTPGSGELRFYQAHYRNAASYCTSATFNVTNGWSVVW